MGRSTLFKIHLLNVVYFMDSIRTAKAFLRVNTKCADVIRMVKLNPFYLHCRHNSTPGPAPSASELARSVNSELRFFPNIETVQINLAHFERLSHELTTNKNIMLTVDVHDKAFDLFRHLHKITHLDIASPSFSLAKIASSLSSLRNLTIRTDKPMDIVVPLIQQLNLSTVVVVSNSFDHLLIPYLAECYQTSFVFRIKGAQAHLASELPANVQIGYYFSSVTALDTAHTLLFDADCSYTEFWAKSAWLRNEQSCSACIERYLLSHLKISVTTMDDEKLLRTFGRNYGTVALSGGGVASLKITADKISCDRTTISAPSVLSMQSPRHTLHLSRMNLSKLRLVSPRFENLILDNCWRWENSLIEIQQLTYLDIRMPNQEVVLTSKHGNIARLEISSCALSVTAELPKVTYFRLSNPHNFGVEVAICKMPKLVELELWGMQLVKATKVPRHVRNITMTSVENTKLLETCAKMQVVKKLCTE